MFLKRLFSPLPALWLCLWLGAIGAALAQKPPGIAATQPTLTLRVVGGLAGLNQYTQFEAPFWSRELEHLSGGKFSANIVPFDRAGVPAAEMLHLVQLGVVPFGTVLLSSLNAAFPQYVLADLAGLNPDMKSLRANLAAFRPYLEQSLRDEQGIEALALYIYPAQMLFCKRPVTNLADVKGWRVRVSSAAQADFFEALGATPVHTEFSQVAARFKGGSIDCAVTGTLSGNTIGLANLTTHLYDFPINWGMAIFGANRAAWEALPADLRELLRRELPKLEAAVWAESERDTALGLACNAGTPACTTGKPGRMRIVPATAADKLRSREIFFNTVLPRWRQRCGARCADVWAQTIGKASSASAAGR